LPNVVELPMVYLALSKLGIICSPIPMQYGAYEITSIIAETQPKAFISIQTFNGNAHAEQFSSIFNNNELSLHWVKLRISLTCMITILLMNLMNLSNHMF